MPASLAALSLLFALSASVAAAQQGRVRIRDTTSSRDSTLLKVTVDGIAIQRLVRELLSSRAMEETIARALREAAGEKADPKWTEELQSELSRIARRNAGLVSVIDMHCAGEEAPPAGYLGVSFNDASVSKRNRESAVYELGDRPVIYSVEPGSPAADAGIRSGDVLVAVGGQDARRPIALAPILKPGSRVSVRIMRDGQARDFNVLVGKRPAMFGGPCASVEDLIGSERAAPMVFFRTPAPATTPRTHRTPGVPLMPAAPETPEVMPVPSPWALLLGMPPFSSVVAGARLTPVDEDWRELVGVDKGLVVTDVGLGTPAKEAGLRKGDVIVSVDDAPVSSVRVFQRALSISESRSVKLQVVRKGKPQTVVLRWQ